MAASGDTHAWSNKDMRAFVNQSECSDRDTSSVFFENNCRDPDTCLRRRGAGGKRNTQTAMKPLYIYLSKT